MTINYKQLKDLVLQELVGDGPGGMMGASAPAGIPHRMPAADPPEKEQDMGDDDANKLYEVALTAREATEQLVEALDEPIYDGAYEHAFKASAALRRCLNELIGVGAHPMPDQRVVASPKYQQKYAGQGRNNAGDFAGGAGGGLPRGSTHGKARAEYHQRDAEPHEGSDLFPEEEHRHDDRGQDGSYDDGRGPRDADGLHRSQCRVAAQQEMQHA